MSLPKTPPTPTTIAREFVTGQPGVIPIPSSAQSQLVNVLPTNLQVASFFSGTVSVAIPALAAGASTTVPQSVSFSSSTYKNGGSFPPTITLKSGQSVFVLASAVQAAAVSGIVVGAPILTPALGTSWSFTGPAILSNLGATLTAAVYSPGATAGETVTFTVWALLLASWSS